MVGLWGRPTLIRQQKTRVPAASGAESMETRYLHLVGLRWYDMEVVGGHSTRGAGNANC
jgi:hypothetical protein